MSDVRLTKTTDIRMKLVPYTEEFVKDVKDFADYIEARLFFRLFCEMCKVPDEPLLKGLKSETYGN